MTAINPGLHTRPLSDSSDSLLRFGLRVDGTPDSVSRLTRDDLLAFWHKQAAQPWVLSVAGDFDRSAVTDFAKALPALMPARVFPPGTVYSYSNFGVALAGAVVESVARKAFSSVVRDRILRPLGMTRSGFVLDEDLEGGTPRPWPVHVLPTGERVWGLTGRLLWRLARFCEASPWR